LTHHPTFREPDDEPKGPEMPETGEKKPTEALVNDLEQSTTVTFSEPGSYYYICTPHPWMYGQVIVEQVSRREIACAVAHNE
jgi:plastocyanin